MYPYNSETFVFLSISAPHMDPAVVAAHPMPTASSMARPPSTHTPESLSQSGFGASSYGEQQTLDSDPQSVDPSIISQQTVTTVQSQDFTNSSFGQSARTQTIQSDNMFSNAVSDNSSGTLSHKVLGQSGTDSSLSQYEIPPSIPLPPGHESSQVCMVLKAYGGKDACSVIDKKGKLQ